MKKLLKLLLILSGLIFLGCKTDKAVILEPLSVEEANKYVGQYVAQNKAEFYMYFKDYKYVLAEIKNDKGTGEAIMIEYEVKLSKVHNSDYIFISAHKENNWENYILKKNGDKVLFMYFTPRELYPEGTRVIKASVVTAYAKKEIHKYIKEQELKKGGLIPLEFKSIYQEKYNLAPKITINKTKSGISSSNPEILLINLNAEDDNGLDRIEYYIKETNIKHTKNIKGKTLNETFNVDISSLPDGRYTLLTKSYDSEYESLTDYYIFSKESQNVVPTYIADKGREVSLCLDNTKEDELESWTFGLLKHKKEDCKVKILEVYKDQYKIETMENCPKNGKYLIDANLLCEYQKRKGENE